MTLRVGVIGGGFGTTALAPAFRSIEGCEVVALAEPRSRWPAFLEQGGLDAVAIAVPPAVQFEIAKEAIERGLHVFAEKPLAAGSLEAAELRDRATARGIVHAVDFMFPEIAQWRAVKDLIDGSSLGVCRHVAVSWTWLSGDVRHRRDTWRTDVAAGGGALSQYFSHGLYYLEHFLGELDDVQGSLRHSTSSANGGEVGFDLLLRFRSGTSGYVHVSSDTPARSSHRLVFECEHGVVVLENEGAVVDNFRVRVAAEDGERQVAVEDEPLPDGVDERVKPVRRVAQKFVDACRGGGGGHPDFGDGARVHELIDTIRSSRGRRVRAE